MAVPRPAGGAPRRVVGIVGGGMAGIALAWLIDGECDVVLLESKTSLGGNAETVQVQPPGVPPVMVDVGAQYFHPNLYRLYVRLLTELKLYPTALSESHSFPGSISLSADSELFPRFVSPVFWDRLWPIFAPWNWEGLNAFNVGFNAAKARQDQNADWGLTLEAWLQTLSLPQKQWEGMLLPWSASLFTGKIDQARALSARAAMIFAAAAVPANPLDPVVNYVVNRGMAEPLRRMIQQMRTVEILTSARVDQITRVPQNGFLLRCADGRSRRVDDLVLACSGPASMHLLNDLPENRQQRMALSGIEFDNARIALHTDPIYAPADPNHRSFLNCQIHKSYCEASMWLARVLTPPAGMQEVPIWKSWVTYRDKQPANVLHESNFRHMVPTVATLRAQNRLREQQGLEGVWVIGGYTFPYDSQETALASAIRTSVGLKLVSARTRLFSAT